MKGDFTRLSFDPSQAFTRVLMQQGRVQLDSDWNEKQEMDLHAARGSLRDVAGWSGAVSGKAGFAIGLTQAGTDLTIGTGRLYAGGILCENATAGATLSNQPFLPLASGTRPGLAWPAPSGITRYLVYLDVWERDVSALEQPSIRETALGGPDTTTRTRLIWQVRLELTDEDKGTESFPPGWMPAAVTGALGAMLASTTPPSTATGPCVLPPGASYTSLSNQLYRVDIHTSGTLGSGTPPTFKWSRENGSVATTVKSVTGQTLTVADLGPDDRLSFMPGQVVELIDEWMELSTQTGRLLLIDSIDNQANTITIAAATPVPVVDTSYTVLLRRWDQPGTAASATQAVTAAAGPIALEAGIQVQFRPGFYPAGAYWTFPARTAIDSETGNIVWPAPAGTFLPPHGPDHVYVPLALVDFTPPPTSAAPPSGHFVLIEDCRALFSPAAGRLAPMRARYAENNGQQAPLLSGSSVRLDVVAQGMVISSSAQLDASSVSASSVQLVAELPVMLSQLVPGSTDSRVAATQRVALATNISLMDPTRIVVAPTQAAQDLLTTMLSRRFTTGSAADFAGAFNAVDFAPNAAAHANWTVQSDGSIAQTNTGAAVGPGALPLAPSLALATKAPASLISHAGVSFNCGTNVGDAGIVFNWTSNSDFWVFYNDLVWQTIGFSGAVAMMNCFVDHILNGAVASRFVGSSIPAPENSLGHLIPWSADLDIGTTAGGLAFQAVIHTAGGAHTFSLTVPPGTVNFVRGSKLGLMSRGKGDADYTRLQWTDTADGAVNLLPVGSMGSIVLRLITKPSLLRTQAEASLLTQGFLPPPPSPEPDFETAFFVTPAPSTYYGYHGPGAPGIGSELL